MCLYLLNNYDTWTGLTYTAIDELDTLQNLFYRVILQVPTGCPTPMLYWDLGGTLMSNRIWKSKLLLLHHIATLEISSLAYQVYSAQDRLGLPGLVQDCKELLTRFGVTSISKYSKSQWKSLVNKKMKSKNTSALLDKMATKRLTISKCLKKMLNLNLTSKIYTLHKLELNLELEVS